MIFLTGDTHIPIDIDKLSKKNFPLQKNLTRNDYVIVLGDFGLLWKRDKTYEYWLDTLSRKNFTLLWLDGNHENFDWLDELPVTDWHGGKVQLVADNIIHLMRGNIYTIEGKTFFVMGGAASVDQEHRQEHISWWPQEQPNYKELMLGMENFAARDHTVDYILSHTCPYELIRPMFLIDPREVPDELKATEKALQTIAEATTFQHWFFGHWHENKSYGKYHCLYNDVVSLAEYDQEQPPSRGQKTKAELFDELVSDFHGDLRCEEADTGKDVGREVVE